MGTVVLEEKWPVLGRHERAAGWLRMGADLGRAPRTIDAYARRAGRVPSTGANGKASTRRRRPARRLLRDKILGSDPLSMKSDSG